MTVQRDFTWNYADEVLSVSDGLTTVRIGPAMAAGLLADILARREAEGGDVSVALGFAFATGVGASLGCVRVVRVEAEVADHG